MPFLAAGLGATPASVDLHKDCGPIVSKRRTTDENIGMRWRRVVVLVAVIAAAATIGVGGWALIAYNEVTRIDRSEPEVVTDEYLRAALVRKDDVGADLYACNDQSRLEPIK